MRPPKRRDSGMSNAKLRLIYGICAALLLLTEVCIGRFVHDAFIRPYFGDVLVGILIWCVIRVILPRRPAYLSPIVLGFCFLTEFVQLLHPADLLPAASSPLLRILLGNTFSVTDLVCYTCGLFPLFWVEHLLIRKK